ncbi:hypothetical protein CK203_101325 [Vitis vinifera]|uniref:Uncharacterized protein n=1 Tax=Vitis vinifera TaxID=29760 RepID=A0A438C5N7_VITVI|nr:hypothetical protein CK203_101325 [Vitis vinifera]
MCHLECFMTLREFFYPRVAMDFYPSMTIQGAQSPTTIHFSIDGCQDILEARHIAEALHIPYEPVDPAHFQEWSPISQQDMVRILSRRTSGDSFLLRKELPSRMLLVDVLLRSNIFPLQHLVQRRGAILDTPASPVPPQAEQQDELPTESVPLTPTTPPMPEATSTNPPVIPPVPPSCSSYIGGLHHHIHHGVSCHADSCPAGAP